jgi:hypothetical protein
MVILPPDARTINGEGSEANAERLQSRAAFGIGVAQGARPVARREWT